MLLDIIFCRSLAHIFENSGAIGNGFFAFPGLKAIAQSVHITVAADAGVAEQVPGATHSLA